MHHSNSLVQRTYMHVTVFNGLANVESFAVDYDMSQSLNSRS